MSAEQALDVLRTVIADMAGATREGQQDMVRAVWEALESEGHLMVEAGTGTGKSFGYLVPALVWSALTGHRTTVSTATLALQRQIMQQDAPRVVDAVAKLHGTHPKVALLKGWNNYVCLRKATGGYPEDGALLSRAEGELGATATGEEVVRARDWAMATTTGDRDDLQPGVSDRVWSQISVPKRECIGESCPLRSTCFPVLARAEADEADMVVTNHAMLGIEATGTPVLPPTGAYIIDEAHDLVDRVTNQLTRSLSKYDLTGISRMLRRNGIDGTDLEESADDIDGELDRLGEGRLTVLSETLTDAVARLLGRVQAAGEDVSSLSTNDEDSAVSKQILRVRLGEIANLCQDLLSDAISTESLVAWVSGPTEGPFYLNVAPLDVSAPIADSLFQDVPAILTSATLQIGGGFHHMAHRVGFTFPSQGEWNGIDVGTPFAPDKQGVLYVAAHLPQPGKEGYGTEQLDELVDLINASGGGALCLFTSRAASDRAAQYARERLDLRILSQGDDQIPTLVDAFTADENSCLFGTMSLWQGVDVPGRTCRLVIIDKIPFPRPNEPLLQARKEAVDKAGGNGFMSVAASQAALLLAQGAGRLLRRTTDRGVVAVLDPRLRQARYSGFLLASMPPMWPTTDPQTVREVLIRLRDSEGE